MVIINFEGINFNSDWVKTKKEAEFIEHEKHHFENDVDGTKKLKEVYSLIVKTKKAEEKK